MRAHVLRLWENEHFADTDSFQLAKKRKFMLTKYRHIQKGANLLPIKFERC